MMQYLEEDNPMTQNVILLNVWRFMIYLNGCISDIKTTIDMTDTCIATIIVAAAHSDNGDTTAALISSILVILLPLFFCYAHMTTDQSTVTPRAFVLMVFLLCLSLVVMLLQLVEIFCECLLFFLNIFPHNRTS